MWSKCKRFFWEIGIYVVIAGVSSLLLIRYGISAYRIEGESMAPALLPGDRLFIVKTLAARRNLNRFDIVVCKLQGETNRPIIKRIFGLPGDRVDCAYGRWRINGKPTDQAIGGGCGLPSPQAWIIPVGHLFLLGDNQRYSRDSRSFGPIPTRLITGKAVFRYWPPARVGPLPKH